MAGPSIANSSCGNNASKPKSRVKKLFISKSKSVSGEIELIALLVVDCEAQFWILFGMRPAPIQSFDERHNHKAQATSWRLNPTRPHNLAGLN